MQFVVNEEGALSHQRVENEEPGVYHELLQVVVRGVAHDQVVYFQCPCGRIPVSPEHLWTLAGPLFLFLYSVRGVRFLFLAQNFRSKNRQFRPTC